MIVFFYVVQQRALTWAQIQSTSINQVLVSNTAIFMLVPLMLLVLGNEHGGMAVHYVCMLIKTEKFDFDTLFIIEVRVKCLSVFNHIGAGKF